MSNIQKETIDAVRTSLSAARMATFENAAGVNSPDDPAGLLLYAWNAGVSGAFMAPLHICEVVIRNAVSNALEAIYGPEWPWSTTFETSLPNPARGYKPRIDLANARKSAQSTGKVIPELKFVFWQKMFTSRYDNRIWDQHLLRVMPNLDQSESIATLRTAVYGDLERLRLLRNRIAHHEPIFSRPLIEDYQTALKLVTYCCAATAQWMDSNQNAKAILATKP